jgi:hypothetical protein
MLVLEGEGQIVIDTWRPEQPVINLTDLWRERKMNALTMYEKKKGQ